MTSIKISPTNYKKYAGLACLFLLALLIQGCNNQNETKQIDTDKKYLIINGDDLCKNEKTNQAIVKAYKEGILTSTSAFINLEGAVEQIIDIHHENPGLPIGLHLNLTLGSPVAEVDDVSGLVTDEGQFYELEDIFKRLPEIPIEEVRKELHAQVELFMSTGVPLDHIDYHHHLVALYSPYFEIVRELAATYDVPVRNPVPAGVNTLFAMDRDGGASSAGIKKLLLFGIMHPIKTIPLMKEVGTDDLIEQEKLLREEGISTSHWFIDDFYNNATVENFVSILNELPQGVSEIMCHPDQEKELEVLTDPHIRHIIDSLDIELINWKSVK